MTTKHIGVAEAKAKFSALLDGVAHDDEHYIIERNGKPVAALVTPAEFARIEAEQQLGPRPLGALALVGAWAELGDEEIDKFVEDVYRARDADLGRRVELGE